MATNPQMSEIIEYDKHEHLAAPLDKQDEPASDPLPDDETTRSSGSIDNILDRVLTRFELDTNSENTSPKNPDRTD